ncbi:hypothetical protein ARMGADRAFT_175608 [Armillaria gallica]|uniref:Uncharacterized protein n=1 Tax=Armillaria gallica TaxID=47427 RepID=A0A2H3CJ46_ARMGA|nr:hypothetical protein ARMGADRAFT_175608 [Armillaria gallica]
MSRLSALSNFSIGDIFKDIRDGPKSVKFPEKLLKVLEQKLHFSRMLVILTNSCGEQWSSSTEFSWSAAILGEFDLVSLMVEVQISRFVEI